MPVTVRGQLVCDECDAKADVDLETVEFGHDKNCLFVKEPSEYQIDNGWALVHESDYDRSQDVWLCPKHWKETKGWPGKERKY